MLTKVFSQPTRLSRFAICILFWLLLVAKVMASSATYTGVNLSGAEFGGSALPGIYGTDYIYPNDSEIDYFSAKGMNVFRLPFRWERLQPALNATLNTTELARIDAVVNYATRKNVSIILDPHNNARYYGNPIGSAQVPTASFVNFWSQLANYYKGNSRVIFGLMNEPYEMDTTDWVATVNATIVGIRSTGATNLILIPGNGWTGAHSWTQTWYDTPNQAVSNADAMINVVDSQNNYAFEVHQYLNNDSSGGTFDIVSPTIGAERLVEFTDWLRQNNKRGFLTEFAASRNTPTFGEALDNMLTYIDNNNDVWLGWTAWAGGPWWGDYDYALDPVNSVDRPQMAILAKHKKMPRPNGFDFNGDGKSDVLWRDLTGLNYLWTMNVPIVTQLVSGTTDWQIVGVGDFDGDGKSDIVWRQPATGINYLWRMNGAILIAYEQLVSAAPDWYIAGVGDFNGDGKSDILWRQQGTGINYLWYMNGAILTAFEQFITVPADWRLMGVGDFDGDGKSDMLWRHSSGVNYLWLMNGLGLVIMTVSSDWSVVGVGDFDDDGRSDILWRQPTTGLNYIWRMNGGNIVAMEQLSSTVSDWYVASVGDFNGDGKSDIFWRQTGIGTNYVWSMNGATIAASELLLPVSSDWAISYSPTWSTSVK